MTRLSRVEYSGATYHVMATGCSILSLRGISGHGARSPGARLGESEAKLWLTAIKIAGVKDIIRKFGE